MLLSALYCWRSCGWKARKTGASKLKPYSTLSCTSLGYILLTGLLLPSLVNLVWKGMLPARSYLTPPSPKASSQLISLRVCCWQICLQTAQQVLLPQGLLGASNCLYRRALSPTDGLRGTTTSTSPLSCHFQRCFSIRRSFRISRREPWPPFYVEQWSRSRWPQDAVAKK